jgi:hypothetical protein
MNIFFWQLPNVVSNNLNQLQQLLIQYLPSSVVQEQHNDNNQLSLQVDVQPTLIGTLWSGSENILDTLSEYTSVSIKRKSHFKFSSVFYVCLVTLVRQWTFHY